MSRIAIILTLLSCLACRTNSTRFNDQQGTIQPSDNQNQEDDQNIDKNQDKQNDSESKTQVDSGTSIELEPEEVMIRYQEKIRVRAVLTEKGKKIDISKKGEWRSTDQANVTVDQTGLVTGIKLGCNVIFTYQGKRFAVPVIVNPKPIIRLQYGSLQIKPNSLEPGKGRFRFRLENVKETDVFEITPVFSSDFTNIQTEFMPFAEAANYGHREFSLSFDNTFNKDTATYDNQVLTVKIVFNPDSYYEFEDPRSFEQKIVDNENNVLSSGPNYYFEGTEGFSSSH